MHHALILKYDIDCALSLHLMMKHHLDDSDPMEMSKRTPLGIIKSINKLCHSVTGVVPKLECIIQDLKRYLIVS
jgi:hypothetical protein